MEKKILSTIAVTLTATILGGCAAMPAASAEDFTKESSVGTQEISIFEPKNTLLESVQDTIVPDTQDDDVQASDDATQAESKEITEDSSADTGNSDSSMQGFNNSDVVSTGENVTPSHGVANADILSFMREIAPEMGYTVRVVDSSELTLRDIEERTGQYVLVERMDCIVQDNEGNGRVLNVPEGECGDYIKFDPEEFSAGDLVEVYCTYADSPYTDDIESRADFLVGTLQEVESVYRAK